MGGTEQSHIDIYKDIINYWNYDASRTVTNITSSLGL